MGKLGPPRLLEEARASRLVDAAARPADRGTSGRRANAGGHGAQKRGARHARTTIDSMAAREAPAPHENVTLGEHCDVHATATLDASVGPIELGAGTTVGERVLIRNERAEPMIVGAGNVFEAAADVRAAAVGDFNVFRPRCRVDAGVVVGSGCSVGAGARVAAGEIADGTAVFRTGDFADTRACPDLLDLHKALAGARAAASAAAAA